MKIRGLRDLRVEDVSVSCGRARSATELKGRALHLQIALLRLHSILYDEPSFASNSGIDKHTGQLAPLSSQQTAVT